MQHKAVKVAVTACYGEAPVGLPQLRVVTGPLFVLPVFFFSPLGKVYILPSFLSFLMISRRQIIWRSAGPIFTIFTSNERNFYLFFSFSFFLMISRRQIIWRSAGPIFTIFTSNESFLAVDDRSGSLFSISQGTLPWQPFCAKLPTPCTYGSGIQKRYEVTPCMGRIK